MLDVVVLAAAGLSTTHPARIFSPRSLAHHAKTRDRKVGPMQHLPHPFFGNSLYRAMDSADPLQGPTTYRTVFKFRLKQERRRADKRVKRLGVIVHSHDHTTRGTTARCSTPYPPSQPDPLDVPLGQHAVLKRCPRPWHGALIAVKPRESHEASTRSPHPSVSGTADP